MPAGGKTGVVKRQVEDIFAQPSNPLGKGIAGVGDDQAVELTGTVSEELLGGCNRMAAECESLAQVSFDAFRS